MICVLCLLQSLKVAYFNQAKSKVVYFNQAESKVAFADSIHFFEQFDPKGVCCITTGKRV
jgi:hypothetical protein